MPKSSSKDPGTGPREGKLSSYAGIMAAPLFICVFFFAGFIQLKSDNEGTNIWANESDTVGQSKKNVDFNFVALLAGEEFSRNLRDTIYTDDEKYLELRIDEQMLYIHHRDGNIVSYAVSSGNKFISKGIESRNGLFAIFLKEELHLSSQFNDAKMFYYMPFNMGIGFHSLAGSGYYGNLGVRPSSHGCIRMRTVDVKALFNECEVGTLVLVHRGKSARVIAFAPEGFSNEKEYTKDEYMNMLAYNLNSIYEGRYFIDPPMRFIIDGKLIPKIGFNIGTADRIPGKQQIPLMITKQEQKKDRMSFYHFNTAVLKEFLEPGLAENLGIVEDDTGSKAGVVVSEELVKKLAYNPEGILPYFPPDR